MPAATPHAPVRVTLVVYDLLPAGRLASAAFMFGLGIYHTAVRISAPVDREYAFGGHPYPSLTGIFSTPAREDHKPPIEGLRWLRDVDMGEIKMPSLEEHVVELRPEASSGSMGSKALPRVETDKDLPETPTRSSASQDDDGVDGVYAPSSKWQYPPRSSSPTSSSVALNSYPAPSSSDSPKPSPAPPLPSTPAAQLQFFKQVLSHLQASPAWKGTSYDLLQRNCNSFSDELCRLLTGKGIPGWCNRAAALGGMLPCLVPQDWVEPPSAPATPNMPATYERIHMAV